MRDTYALAALRRKRAPQAGEIEATERQLAAQRETLAQIDTAIGLFDPGADLSVTRSIRPARRCLHFRHEEQMRLCLGALRSGPTTVRQVNECAMRAKPMDAGDGALRALIIEQIRVALAWLAAKGQVWKVVPAPDDWWEGRDPCHKGGSR